MQTQMFGLARAGASPRPPAAHARAARRRGDRVRAPRGPRHPHARPHPGSICLFFEESGQTPLLFAGDTLFKGSIGRTDLWGGSLPAIQHSIRDRLLTLPDATLVVPGHGAETTVGAEREDNPFVGRFAR